MPVYPFPTLQPSSKPFPISFPTPSSPPPLSSSKPLSVQATSLLSLEPSERYGGRELLCLVRLEKVSLERWKGVADILRWLLGREVQRVGDR